MSEEKRFYNPQISVKAVRYPSHILHGVNTYRHECVANFFDVDIMIDENVKEWYTSDTFMPSTDKSIGFDLRAVITNNGTLTIGSGDRIRINTGVHIQPKEPGINGYIFSRSGLGAKEGLVVAQGVGVIDPDYNGPIYIWLLNTSKKPITVQHGDRIAQLIFMRYELPMLHFVDKLEDTTRNDGGFGSTGTK